MAYNVENLPSYSDAQSRDFVLKTVFENTPTIDFLETMGSYHANAHVGSTDIQLLDTDVVWQDGKACTVAELGSVDLDRTPLKVVQIAQNMSLCNADLEDTYASADLNAKRQGLALDDALFLDAIIDDISKKNSFKLEKLLWQGDVSKTTDNTLKWFDGYEKQLATGGYDLSGVTGADIIEKLQNAYLAMPEEITGQVDFRIIMSKKTYNKYKIAVQRKNLFDAGAAYTLIGTDAEIQVVHGMSADKAFFARARNLRLGGNIKDMGIKNHYSQDDDNVKVRMRLSSGVTAIYKQEIGVLDLAESAG